MATSSSNAASLLLGLIGCGLYGFAYWYLILNPNSQTHKLYDLMPEPLRVYGQIKFLTFQCLVIQLISSVLHVLAHFVGSLRGLRDLVFTGLAYPVGSLVVYSFWGVWFTLGREFIFPKELDTLYPPTLNHLTHTAMVPLNALLCLTVSHKYSSVGAVLNLAYMLAYTALLHYIKFESGHFVYIYLEHLNDTQRIIYFVGTGIFSFFLYRTGRFLSSLGSGKQAPSKAGAKKQKQK